MKSALWLIVGTGLGFVVAHLVNSTAGGRAAFQKLDAHSRGFADALLDGYRTRGRELRDSAGGGTAL